MAERGARGQRGIPVNRLDDVRGLGCDRAITVVNVGHCPPPPLSRWTIAQSSAEPALSGGLGAAFCFKTSSPADRANALDRDVCPLPNCWFGERMGRFWSGSVAADRWLERLGWVDFGRSTSERQGSEAAIAVPAAHIPFADKRRGRFKVVTTPLHTRPCRMPIYQIMLNLMVQCLAARLDASFAALSDATRRGVLEHLGRADASITELADTFHMTLTGMKKHVGILERAGLVTTQKVGRVRTCKLGRSTLAEETAWIEAYRGLWASRFDALDQIVEELKQRETSDGRRQTK
jgi:DNA-binding transcriptional ArsR family regulator